MIVRSLKRVPRSRVSAAAWRGAKLAVLVGLAWLFWAWCARPALFPNISYLADMPPTRDTGAFLRAVERLNRGDVDRPDIDGVTPLLVAVGRLDRGAVEDLLARGADVNRVHPVYGSPLMRAFKSGGGWDDAPLPALLLRHGADPSAMTPHGYTPLVAAAHAGSREGTRMLLDRGIAPNPPGVSTNPLVAPAADGDVELLRLLLDYGVDPNVTGRDGELPAVAAAATRGSPDCLRALLSAGADPDRRDRKGRNAWTFAERNADVAAALREWTWEDVER
jgi:ankyrin repeat protein